jgi:rRNA maturation RNase YbeY
LKINFINKVKLSLKKELKDNIKKVVREISIKEGKKIYSLNMIFCDDNFIKECNKEYLGHDYSTDIITFHDENEKGETEGELLMSAETISENALRFKTSEEEELKRVVIHGVLHLCGYKDKSSRQKVIMRKKENEYLKIN